MSRDKVCYASLFFLAAATCFAQSREPSDAWLIENYRFAGPPAPGEIPQVSPTVAQLQEIQNTTLSILRKANFAGDYEAALAAAARATATAQLIGALTGQLKPPQPAPPPAKEPAPKAPAAYRIALEDRTIVTAPKVWSDGTVLHYLTPQGAHGQVRLDRVDWKLSAALNYDR
jgi:hypothetical protein